MEDGLRCRIPKFPKGIKSSLLGKPESVKPTLRHCDSEHMDFMALRGSVNIIGKEKGRPELSSSPSDPEIEA